MDEQHIFLEDPEFEQDKWCMICDGHADDGKNIKFVSVRGYTSNVCLCKRHRRELYEVLFREDDEKE